MPRKLRTPWLDRERGQPNYYIYWHDQSAGRVKRQSTGTTDRIEAEKELADFLLKRADGQKHAGTTQRPDRYTIATALRWYAQERGVDLASSVFTGYAIEYLSRFFGEKAKVSSITPQKIIEYEQQRTVSSGTVRRELVVLSAALNHAVKNGRLSSAPKFPLPKAGRPKDRFLSQEEINWLLKGCGDPHIKLFVLLALNTGARKGAILDLRWPQVDLVNKLVYLNPPDRDQTLKRRATVPMNSVLHETLISAHATAVEAEKRRREKNPNDKRPICPNVISYKNQPVINVKKGFRAACDRAERLHNEWLEDLKREDVARYKQEKDRPLCLKEVTPHTLRHTAGTLMAQAGIDIFMIAKMLGHTVAKTTELYAHHKPDYLKPAADVLARFTSSVK